jgi:SAM-dependent methyltransferase
MDSRIAREIAFHNHAYTEDVRNPARKYYLSIQASIDFYRDFLQSHSPGKDVLEYGCGENSYAAQLSKWQARTVAIDISDVAIEHCRQAHIPNARFEVMNAEVLTCDDDSFDIVCGVAILHHLDVEKAAAEIARVLRPDGVAMFREPLAHNPIINLYRKLTPQLRTPDEHPFSTRDLEIFDQHFGNVRKVYFHLFSLLATPVVTRPGGKFVLRLLSAIDRMVFRLIPPARRYAWSVTLVMSQPVKKTAP